jgi:hypothetical protein
MEIEILTISDFAENYNNRLMIIGTFDSITSQKFPTTQPSCALSMRLRFGGKESGYHKIQLKFLDPKGTILQSIDGDLNVGNPNPGTDYTSVNFVLHLSNLQFNTPGKYSFSLYVDNEWRSGLPVNLIQAQ